jgi:hypothetical protein
LTNTRLRDERLEKNAESECGHKMGSEISVNLSKNSRKWESNSEKSFCERIAQLKTAWY